MWKFKKKIWPKNKTSIPTGKFNHQGKLVTSPEDMKILLAKEYSEKFKKTFAFDILRPALHCIYLPHELLSTIF